MGREAGVSVFGPPISGAGLLCRRLTFYHPQGPQPSRLAAYPGPMHYLHHLAHVLVGLGHLLGQGGPARGSDDYPFALQFLIDQPAPGRLFGRLAAQVPARAESEVGVEGSVMFSLPILFESTNIR